MDNQTYHLLLLFFFKLKIGIFNVNRSGPKNSWQAPDPDEAVPVIKLFEFSIQLLVTIVWSFLRSRNANNYNYVFHVCVYHASTAQKTYT